MTVEKNGREKSVPRFIQLSYLSSLLKTFKRIQPGEFVTAMERVRYRRKIKVFSFFS
jgi:hypothetical protein